MKILPIDKDPTKTHPLDKEMPCPLCDTVSSPMHYDDGTLDKKGMSTLYTPFWFCDNFECNNVWDIEDMKE